MRIPVMTRMPATRKFFVLQEAKARPCAAAILANARAFREQDDFSDRHPALPQHALAPKRWPAQGLA
jgi:hypothetical protein